MVFVERVKVSAQFGAEFQPIRKLVLGVDITDRAISGREVSREIAAQQRVVILSKGVAKLVGTRHEDGRYRCQRHDLQRRREGVVVGKATVDRPRQVHVYAQRELFGGFVVQVDASAQALKGIADQNTVLIEILHRHKEARLGVAAAGAQVQLAHGCFLKSLRLPVGIGRAVFPGGAVSAAKARETVISASRQVAGGQVAGSDFVLDGLRKQLHVLLGVQPAAQAGRLAASHLIAETELGLARLALFGSQQHDAVGRPRSVNGRRRGIFKNID